MKETAVSCLPRANFARGIHNQRYRINFQAILSEEDDFIRFLVPNLLADD